MIPTGTNLPPRPAKVTPLAHKPHPASATTVSENGLELIAREEGCEYRPYNDLPGDPATTCTVGVGHALHPGPCTPAELDQVYTRAEVLELLRHDIADVETAIRAIGVHLTQPQFDALADFAYNCGTGALSESDITAALRAGQYTRIPGIMGEYVHDGDGNVLPDLVARRRVDGELFAHGTY